MREERLDDMMGADVIDPSWLNARFKWSDGEGTAPSVANETVCRFSVALLRPPFSCISAHAGIYTLM